MALIFASLKGALLLCAQLFLIIVPLTILYEFLKLKQPRLNQDRYSFFGISRRGLVPLVTGVVIGLTYGAGVIIHSVRSTDIGKKEAFLILLYLSVCHAIVEDTLIFAVIGANALILVVARVFLATALTYLTSAMSRRRRARSSPSSTC
jgi:hypothetical protein